MSRQKPSVRFALALALSAGASPAWALANPASVLCLTNGGKVVIETAPNGSQVGICVFPDGSRINEWAYFRSKHRTKN